MTESAPAPPRIIAVDIDGTLLSTRGMVLPGTRAEFARARRQGATIVFASGRPVVGLQQLTEKVRLDTAGSVLVGGNGSRSVHADSGAVLARHGLDFELTARIARLAAQHDIVVMMCEDDALIVDRPDEPQVIFEAEGNGQVLRAVSDLTELAEDDVDIDKVLMYADPPRLRPFSEAFEAEFAGAVEYSFSAPFYFEATAKGVDKGSALVAVAKALDVPLGEVVAFGDNGNDLPMIQAAGLGVAMANGTAAVREAADRVTASNDEEGIAAVLADLFGGGVPAPPVPEPDGVKPLYALDLRDPTEEPHPRDE